MQFLAGRIVPSGGKNAAGSGKYARVVTSDASAFTIDDDEDDKMTIDELSAMHHELLQQASSALSSTEDSVNWLKEERQQAAAAAAGLASSDAVRVVSAFDAMKPRRRLGCCPSACTPSYCTIM